MWGGLGWAGVGWPNNVHVPVHTQARQTHHLSCNPADTGTALSSSVTAGWGGIITFMFLYTRTHTHRHGNRHCSFIISCYWGGVGWGGVGMGGLRTFMFLYTHRHGNRHCSFIIRYYWGGGARERERKRGDLNHLSVHQWLRSAIPDSQQPISPIGFLFLKLPPPPCAVLLALWFIIFLIKLDH